jgi:hypothetical protein
MTGLPDATRRRLATVLLVASLSPLLGCELDGISRLGGHPEIADVVLLSETGQVLEPSVTLPGGGPHVVTVQFRDARDRPITSVGIDHRTSLVWEPVGLESTSPVAGDPFSHEVTFLEPCMAPQQVLVGYGHDTRADERIFGPFPVEVPPGVGSARIFAESGEEMTAEVRLPSMIPVEIEVRFYNCDGQPATGLEDDHELLLFWPRVGFAEWDDVVGEPFRKVVTVQEPAETQGAISVGLRKVGERAFESYGPYPVIVHDSSP